MTIEIYHLNTDIIKENLTEEMQELYFAATGFAEQAAIKELLNLSMYRKVAEIRTDDLEQAYKLSNSIDYYWGENAEVTLLNEKNKSSSVGDIFVQDNKGYVVATMGFNELSQEELTLLRKDTGDTKNKKLKLK